MPSSCENIQAWGKVLGKSTSQSVSQCVETSIRHGVVYATRTHPSTFGHTLEPWLYPLQFLYVAQPTSLIQNSPWNLLQTCMVPRWGSTDIFSVATIGHKYCWFWRVTKGKVLLTLVVEILHQHSNLPNNDMLRCCQHNLRWWTRKYYLLLAL